MDFSPGRCNEIGLLLTLLCVPSPHVLPFSQESKGFMGWLLSKTIRDCDGLGAGYEAGLPRRTPLFLVNFTQIMPCHPRYH